MKKYTRKDMLNFAQHCMMALLEKPAKDKNSFSTIESIDLWRISQVLKKYNN